MRSCNAEVVEQQGFKVLTAVNGEEAFFVLEKYHGDIALVLSDLRMPSIDGLMLREKMLPKMQEVPFAIISGYVTREIAMRGIELKITAFVEKPHQEAEIVRLLKSEATSRREAINERKELEQCFVSETRDSFELIEPVILQLDPEAPDAKAVDQIFRMIHTIKGSSAFFNNIPIAKFVHKFEDLLASVKNGGAPLTSEVIASLLGGLDHIKAMVASLETGDGREFDIEQMLASIAMGDLPSEVTLKAKPSMPLVAQPKISSPSNMSTAKERPGVRVSMDLLDEFMSLSGEITVIRNMVNKLVRAIEKEHAGNKNVVALGELFDEMHKINTALQNKILELRKISIGSVYRPLQRTVHDLGASLRKSIKLQTAGDQLRVDTALSQVLADSLIHLVRNSADHGLETPEERLTAGKTAEGLISIDTRVTQDAITISVSDDGKGLDSQRIREKIVEKSLATADVAAGYSEKKLFSMIFESGFSTAKAVTDVSGRGVGMDSVRSAVERAKGRIDVSSIAGAGTTFTMHLPVPKSVVIVSSLLVHCADECFAIPQDSIFRVVHIKSQDKSTLLASLEGGSVLRLEESLIPLIDLSVVLNLRQERTLLAGADETALSIVVVRSNIGLFGIIIDEVLDIEDIVVKPLDNHLRTLLAFAGATFLGNGQVGLIINVEGIADLGHLKSAELEREAELLPSLSEERITADQYVIFALSAPGLFALPLGDVFRLEELAPSSVRHSGHIRCVIYRDTMMPLIDLKPLLGFKGTTKPNKSDLLQVLVVNHDDRLWGMELDAIIDIASASTSLDTSIASRDVFLGTLYINDRTVTLLDCGAILKAFIAENYAKKPSKNAATAHGRSANG